MAISRDFVSRTTPLKGDKKWLREKAFCLLRRGSPVVWLAAQLDELLDRDVEVYRLWFDMTQCSFGKKMFGFAARFGKGHDPPTRPRVVRERLTPATRTNVFVPPCDTRTPKPGSAESR